MNFLVCGDKFAKISDFIYTIPNPDDYYKYPNTFTKEAVDAFNGIPIIYTLTGNVKSLFAELAKVNKKVVVITHSADINITKELYDLCPPNVKKWFAQNVLYHDVAIWGIPIGIENPQRIEFHHVEKEKKLLAKLQEDKIYKNLVYLNCSGWTNPAERLPLYKHLENKPWVTTVRNPNIFDFDSYIDNIYGHKFVACPAGNGIDTHRTWETLYLGGIPIEKRSPHNYYWDQLPICFVNSWDEITEEFLNKEYKRIMTAEANNQLNLGPLDFAYWERMIKLYTIS